MGYFKESIVGQIDLFRNTQTVENDLELCENWVFLSVPYLSQYFTVDIYQSEKKEIRSFFTIFFSLSNAFQAPITSMHLSVVFPHFSVHLILKHLILCVKVLSTHFDLA